MQTSTGQAKEAEAVLGEAALAAEAGHADKLLADTLIQLMRVVGIDQERSADGMKLAAHALAVAERVGNDDQLRAQVALMRSGIESAAAHFQEALADAQQGVAFFVRNQADEDGIPKPVAERRRRALGRKRAAGASRTRRRLE
jgi:hypothetical protein